MTGQRSRDAASDANAEPHGRAARRFRLGAALFLIGLGCPALIPLVATSSLPSAWKATLSAFLAVGIPELFSLAAVAILGKSGFEHLKGLLFGILRRYAPAERVSRSRYRIGLLMFLLPLLFGWLTPYVAHFIPGYEANRVVLGAVGDAMYLASFFVLGGEFWDKVRALFHHGATAVFPRATAS